jgi:hypothetical protein
MPGITKAMRDLTINGTTASGLSRVGYLDIAEQLSRTNRKLFDQGMVYGLEDITFLYTPSPDYDIVQVTVSTAGDTWSVHNAWVKGKALWDQMQLLVLEDNPSISGKWHDFKVYLDNTHRVLSAAGNNMNAITSEGAQVLPGEWNYSDYVLPQHNVDPVTGLPLLADQCVSHLLGADSGSVAAGNLVSVGLVNAYEESRATVFANAPNVPAGFADSFFNLLTDSGSQEPELAVIIEAENNNPPYDLLNYPGGDGNSVDPFVNGHAAANSAVPTATIPGFLAQCGLVKFVVRAYNVDAVTGAVEIVAAPDVTLIASVAPGMYKGVAAIRMGQ